MSDLPPAPWLPRYKRLALVLAVAAVVCSLAFLVPWWTARISPDSNTRAQTLDPRLTLPSPFLNVRPDVKYVGDQACADCHAEQFEQYRQHPMGRSLAPVAKASSMERFEAAARNPFIASGLHYGV